MLAFLSSCFPTWPKMAGEKFKYLKIKKSFKKHFSTFWSAPEAVIGGYSPSKVFFFFQKESNFVALEIDWSNSSICQIFCNVWSLMCENTYFFQEEICTLAQGILLAPTPIDGNIFEFQDGKPNFAALFGCFCKGRSISPRDVFSSE